MSRAGTIWVSDPDGNLVSIGPDDKVPAWAKGMLHARHSEAGPDGPPPRSGKGSGAAAWEAYAAAQGVEIGDDASKDDVIAACQAAGVPVEPDAE